MGGAGRVVAVPPGRLAGWLDRFEQRHPGPVWSTLEGQVVLVAADGARARIRLPADVDVPPAAAAPELVSRAESFRDFGLVLVRRGGFAVGRVADAMLAGSRCGTRYVQGQTKAGGWSQQRFARRRANQADELVGAAAQAVRDVLGAPLRDQGFPLVGGGDRQLVGASLELAGRELSGRLPGGRSLTDRLLPDHLDVPDPRRRVLEAAVDQARAVRITLNQLA
jgi:hypothetical protein